MNDQERQRRLFAAQGLAAMAFFVFAHVAHAATPPAHAQHATKRFTAAMVHARR
jgi:hypothetical protein